MFKLTLPVMDNLAALSSKFPGLSENTAESRGTTRHWDVSLKLNAASFCNTKNTDLRWSQNYISGQFRGNNTRISKSHEKMHEILLTPAQTGVTVYRTSHFLKTSFLRTARDWNALPAESLILSSPTVYHRYSVADPYMFRWTDNIYVS